jgi:hypothetical protein
MVALFALAVTVSSCAQSTEEDRKTLVGLWQPEDGSPHTVEFKDNMEFDFVYEARPVKTILRLGWALGRKGRINILQHDGAVARTCHYSISVDRLTIDDGSGAECLRSATTPTTLMPKSFRRALSRRP